MQGLADGYFILPYTVGNFLAAHKPDGLAADTTQAAAAVQDVQGQVRRLLDINGSRTVDTFHRELGQLMWEYCGMARSEDGLRTALEKIPALRAEFWRDVRVLGGGETLNQSLEKAGRVADFLELGELMCRDALQRTESAGGHFRVESQTPDGEAKRKDDEFSYVAAWMYQGDEREPRLDREPLDFEYVHLAQRSYK
jgi:succinate dehydrogenase / fumarate reductase flavoprotein subunit